LTRAEKYEGIVFTDMNGNILTDKLTNGYENTEGMTTDGAQKSTINEQITGVDPFASETENSDDEEGSEDHPKYASGQMKKSKTI